MKRMRTRVRAIASTSTRARSARKTIDSRTCPAAAGTLSRQRFSPSSDRLRTLPSSVPITSCNSGSAGTASAASVQSQGEPGRTVQPRASSKTRAGGTRLRRRLSRIFQRSMVGKGFGACPPAVGTRRPIQGRICQSPRTQRCSRRAYAW